MAIHRAAGDPGNLAIGDHGPAVLNNGYPPANQGDIERLPDVGLALQFRCGCNKPVHATRVVACRLVLGLGLDLHFVATAEVNAAVGIHTAIEFYVQLEILELRIADQFGSVSRGHEIAIFHGPCWLSGTRHVPSCQVLAIEEGDRIAPLRWSLWTRQFRRPNAGPFPG